MLLAASHDPLQSSRCGQVPLRYTAAESLVPHANPQRSSARLRYMVLDRYRLSQHCMCSLDGDASAQAEVLVCARGGGGLLRDRMALVAQLWAAGIKAEVCTCQHAF